MCWQGMGATIFYTSVEDGSYYVVPSLCLSERPSVLLEYRRECFHETLYKYKASSKDMQRPRPITPPTFLTELCPFANFTMEIVSQIELPNAFEYFHKIWYKYKALSGDVQRTRTIIPPTF